MVRTKSLSLAINCVLIAKDEHVPCVRFFVIVATKAALITRLPREEATHSIIRNETYAVKAINSHLYDFRNRMIKAREGTSQEKEESTRKRARQERSRWGKGMRKKRGKGMRKKWGKHRRFSPREPRPWNRSGKRNRVIEKQTIFFAGRRIAPRPPRARHFSVRIAARVGRWQCTGGLAPDTPYTRLHSPREFCCTRRASDRVTIPIDIPRSLLAHDQLSFLSGHLLPRKTARGANATKRRVFISERREEEPDALLKITVNSFSRECSPRACGTTPKHRLVRFQFY